MGYSGERASMNQFESLYEYCQNNVIDTLSIAFSANKKHTLEGLQKQLPFVYQSTNEENVVPLVSFDGGIATLFQHELAETKLIKVAGASPPEWESTFNGYLEESYFHVMSGLLKWPKGADLDEEEDLVRDEARVREDVCREEVAGHEHVLLRLDEI